MEPISVKVEPIAVTKQQAAGMTSISVRKLDQLVKRGLLKVTKVDRRVLIPVSSLRELIENGIEQHRLSQRSNDDYGTN